MRDDAFIRGKIPMTKSEVRAVSLSKLEPARGSIVYDIGAGTGSVSIEAAMMVPDGRVYAFEEKEEGCELIRQNAERFQVTNLTVVPGRAPGTLRGLAKPDCVFIGGSGGDMVRILDFLSEQAPEARVVLNAVALETLSRVTNYLEEHMLHAEIVSLSVARAEKRGRYHLMQGQNPVYIITVYGFAPMAKGSKNGRFAEV